MIFVSITFIFFLNGQGQGYPYKNLVLEGGGIKGFAYIGAFEVLDSLGILQQIEKVGGSSVGAIQATLLAIGYTPAEMKTLSKNIPLKSFNDGFFPGGISRLKRNFGFYKGEKIYSWLEEMISAKTGDADITFMQLHQQAIEKNYKDLYITGTDLTYRTLRIFSYQTFPAMRIKDALRISLSIPLYFEPVLIDDEGRIVKEGRGSNVHLMVDGGLLSNFPLQMFDTSFVKDGKEMEQLNNNTLGLLLDKPEQVKYLSQQKGIYPIQMNTLGEYLVAVYKTIIDKPNPDNKNVQRTITISDMNLSGRPRKLSEATINKLVENGREGVRIFLNNKEVDKLKASPK